MAGKNPIRPPTIRDPQDQFQREVNRSQKQANQVQQDSRVYRRNISVATTSTAVKHGLGRIPVGWQVTDTVANVAVWRDSTKTSTADTIYLIGSSACVVDLVFW